MTRKRALLVAAVVAAAMTVAGPASAATFTFRGRGWGHGAGMSQWGARGLAEQGLTATPILKRYYTGTEVKKVALPSDVRVGLLQERAEIWVEGDGAFGLYNNAGTKKASGAAGERWRIVPDGTALEVFSPDDDDTPVFRSGVPVTVKFETVGTQLHLPQTGYDYNHGRLDVDINPSTGKTRAILIVPFEQYLYGLGEMPSSWHTEALEAQAIAGRTYALEKITRLGQGRSVCNCGVYASTADQAYVGASHEVSRWVSAVDKTAGLVVTHGGKPIQAYYSSSTGGFTENNENVFGGTALPYLRGVCDPGDWFDGTNPHGAWTVTYDGTEVASRLADAGHNVGTVQDIDYLDPRGVSGRVIGVQDATHGGVRVEGSLKDVRLSGGTFRSIMGLKSNLILHHIIGSIRLRYDAMNCKPKLPTGAEYTHKDLTGTVRGKAQSFTAGRMFSNSSSGSVFWVNLTMTQYYDARRAKGVDYGLPTADSISVTGAVTGGKMTAFERANVFWTEAYGSHEVRGAILTKFLKTGGYKKWGFPTTDELPAPSDGATSRFEKARFYWCPDCGAHPVYGAILELFKSLGGAPSKLGMPVSDEYSISTGRRQDFQHGYITWNSSTGKTAYKLT